MATPEHEPHNHLLIYGVAGLAAAAMGGAVAGAEPAAAYQKLPHHEVVVEQGDTLTKIVHEETGEDGTQLTKDMASYAQDNNLKDPNLIYPDMHLKIDPNKHGDTVVLRYGDTLWGAVQKHFGHANASLIDQTARVSGINPNHYLAGTVVHFSAEAPKPRHHQPEAKTPEAEQATWVVKSAKETPWALSYAVAHINGITHKQAMEEFNRLNPGLDAKNLKLNDTFKLGVTNQQLAKFFKDIESLASQHPKAVHEQRPAKSVAKPAAAKPTTQPVPPPTSPKELVKQILNSPNVTIQNSPNNRVKKSLEDVSDNGATFTHDTANDNKNEVEVSKRLLQVIDELSQKYKIEITSLTTGEHASHSLHYEGRAIDLAINADSAAVFTELYNRRTELGIDELIWANPPANTHNLSNGVDHAYGVETLSEHQTHIHLGFFSKDALPQPTPQTPPTATPNSPAPETTSSPENIASAPYSVDTDVLSKSGLSADQLNKLLEGTPMAGLGQNFLDLETKYGINAYFALEHARLESASGGSPIAEKKHNLFGLNAYDSCPATCAHGYPDFATSIDAYGNFLLSHYLTPTGMWYGGGTAITNVFVHYSSAGQAEAQDIAQMMNRDINEARAA